MVPRLLPNNRLLSFLQGALSPNGPAYSRIDDSSFTNRPQRFSHPIIHPSSHQSIHISFLKRTRERHSFTKRRNWCWDSVSRGRRRVVGAARGRGGDDTR